MCSRRFQNKHWRILGGDDTQLREEEAQLDSASVWQVDFIFFVMDIGASRCRRCLGDDPALTVIASESIDFASSKSK